MTKRKIVLFVKMCYSPKSSFRFRQNSTLSRKATALWSAPLFIEVLFQLESKFIIFRENPKILGEIWLILKDFPKRVTSLGK